jgi:ribosomal protein S18 acetylase RimI-like enzyme
MNSIHISVEEHASEAECRQVVQGLLSYNGIHAAVENYRDLTVLLRHDGAIVGGLLGYTHWDWLFIKQLWVAEVFQRSGFGQMLMLAAEHEAVSRGCLQAHCDTFDFQALPFYQKLDYCVFGQLEDYPAGHTRYFLHKRTLSAPGNAEP